MIRGIIPLLPLVAAAVALALGAVLVTRPHRAFAHRVLALGLLGVVLLEVGTYLVSRWPGELMPLWVRVLTVGEGLMILGWVLFGAVLARDQSPLVERRMMAALCGGLMVLLPLLVSEPYQMLATPDGKPFLALTGLGRFWSVAALLGAVFALFQLEVTFRALRGEVRRQATLFLLGLAGALGFHLFALSQVLLFASLQPLILRVESAAFLLCLGLMGFGLVRHRFLEVRIFVSRHVLYRSFAVAAVGSYLLGLGVAGELMRRFEVSLSFSLAALAVFSSALGLTFLLSSEKVRRRARRFIDTHFYRNKYDYRLEWGEFTRKLASVVSVEKILPKIVETLTETMGLQRVAIFLAQEGGALAPAERIGLPGEPPRVPADPTVVALLREGREPLSLSGVDPGHPLAAPAARLRALGLVALVPLVAAGELVGLLAVGPPPDGTPFSYEDHDLLMTVAAQGATAILNARLAEQLARTRELEALHRVSSFALHDLKNLVATLGLVTQNAAEHGNDPAFQRDAFRAIESSVRQMRDLIARLSDLPKTLDFHLEPTDVNEVAHAALEQIGPLVSPQIKLVEDLAPVPPVLADREHLQKALYNLMLNGVEAISEAGEVRVATTTRNGAVRLEVADTGQGIPEPLLSHGLFTPFRSTKSRGLGIGLYQVKTIVEAHGGRITVESRHGEGTTIRLELPVEPGAVAAASS